MSALLAVRHARLLTESVAGSSRGTIGAPSVGQTRGYAQAKKGTVVRVAQRFAPKKKGEKKEKPKWPKKPGTFLPLPVNQLSDPIFKSDMRTELQLPVYSPEVLTHRSVGSVMAFPISQNEAIRAYGVPKNLLVEFRVLSRPCSVIRDVTLTAVDTLDAASQQPSREARFVMTGPSGCGKSFLLLQTVEYAAHNNWIVLYIPRAVNLVNSTTAYAYDARMRTYLQPEFSYELLRRFLNVNSWALQDLTSQEELLLEGLSIPSGTALTELVAAGLDNKEVAPLVLSALMDELSRQSTHPVLLAVDDVQSLYGYSSYRDPHFRPIMAQHLSVPHMILQFASGKKSFPRGAFMGAENSSDPKFQTPLELREALGLTYTRPAGPYSVRSSDMTQYAQGLRNFPVPPQLSISEAASLFEVWMQDKALHSGEVRNEKQELHSVPNDELFLTKYTEASGNPRDFIWKGLLSTLSSL